MDNKETMTSLELLDIINEQRRVEGIKGMRHGHFLDKLAKEIPEQLKLSEYLTPRGRYYKCYILSIHTANTIIQSYAALKPRIMTEREAGALATIEQLLDIKLIRQYQVATYRVDGYHKESNTVYEIDETQHFIGGVLRKECVARQQFIEGKLGCTFVRIKV